MIVQYFKQGWCLLKENKLLSTISILGTALAIAMIMCIVLIFQARTADYAPEVNRGRTLAIRMARATKKSDNGWNNGGMISLRVIKDCFYELQTAETVTAVSAYNTRLATTPGGATEAKVTMSGTDDAFWRIFEFRFLHGKPYGEEFISGEKRAVICRSLARRIFGTDDAVGRTLTLSFVDYTVCGVVADVSVLAENAYAEVWIPYTSMNNYDWNHSDGLMGAFSCYILAAHGKTLEEVRAEATANVDRMNEAQAEWDLKLAGGPDSQLMSMARNNIFEDPPVTKFILTYVVVIVILLLVPAINLSGITLSRMKRRSEEIGVRRVYGASRSSLLWQVLSENFVVTIAGGVVGLIFSYVAILILRDWLLNTTMAGYTGSDTSVSADMVISPLIFLAAFLFCLLLNLLSAGIPAWKVSRTEIINAIK